MEPTKKPNPQLIFISMIIQIGMGLYIGQMMYNRLDDKLYAHIAIALAILQNIYSGIKDRNKPIVLDGTKIDKTPKRFTLSNVIAYIFIGLFLVNMKYQYIAPDLALNLIFIFVCAGLATSFIPFILKQINK